MNDWIDTTQQLPPIGEYVLMVISYADRVLIGVLSHDDLCYLDNHNTAEVKYLTHWQPVPEPPGGKRL